MSKKTQNENEDYLMESDGGQISMITEISTDVDESTTPLDLNKEIPVMPLRNMVMFPHVVMPITIGRASTIQMNLRTRRLHNSSCCTSRHFKNT